ncbi:hypothetical protein KBD20_03305 [Candidatus Saccharibacteria bacterium]|nr:hypothetical protein [Candidatus Saccharibacteria bacterium]
MKSSNFQLNKGPQRRSHKIVLVVIVLALIFGAGTYVYLQRQEAQELAEQKALDESQTNSAKKGDATSSKDTGVTPKTESDIKQDVPTATENNVTINSVNQSGGMVAATASVSGASAGGTCVFSFTNPDDKPVIPPSVSIKDGSCSTSTPEVGFSKLGVWNLNVTAYIDGKKSEANQSVTIN